MMPYSVNPGSFGNYWPVPTYMLDGYGQPIPNPQYPIFAYGVPGPVPCEMLYGSGMMVCEPVGHPSCLPAMPPCQRDGADHNVGGSSIMSREEFEARKAELRRKRELELKRAEAKDSERSDPGASKEKRLSRIDNRSVSSRMDDASGLVGKNAYLTCRKMASGSSSPEAVKRNRYKRDTLKVDPRFEQLNEGQKASESSEKVDKKPKGSVFSRISFPDEKDKPKRLLTEKVLASEDSKAEFGVSIGKRVPVTCQDPGNLAGRKSTLKEGRLRMLTNQIESKSQLEDKLEGSDDDMHERNFKRRTSSSSTSPGDDTTRVGKRRHLQM